MSIPAEHMARMQGEPVVDAPAPAPDPATGPAEAGPSEVELTAQDVELARQTGRAEALELALRSRPEPAAAAPAPELKEPAWEEMTTKDIVQLVVQEVRKGDQATRAELGQELLKLRLEQQITVAQEQYPDFMDYSEDVVRISQEKEGRVTPVEAYLLAKARRGQVARRAATPSGGQRPGTSKAAQPKPPANMREAAGRAFEEVFGRKAR